MKCREGVEVLGEMLGQGTSFTCLELVNSINLYVFTRVCDFVIVLFPH